MSQPQTSGAQAPLGAVPPAASAAAPAVAPAAAGKTPPNKRVLTVVALIGMQKWKWGVIPVVLGSASAGLLFR